MSGDFESRVHTLATVSSVAPGHLRLEGVRSSASLYFEPEVVCVSVEEIEPGENSLWGPVLRRLRFVRRAAAGEIALRVVPE